MNLLMAVGEIMKYLSVTSRHLLMGVLILSSLVWVPLYSTQAGVVCEREV